MFVDEMKKIFSVLHFIAQTGNM